MLYEKRTPLDCDNSKIYDAFKYSSYFFFFTSYDVFESTNIIIREMLICANSV